MWHGEYYKKIREQVQKCINSSYASCYYIWPPFVKFFENNLLNWRAGYIKKTNSVFFEDLAILPAALLYLQILLYDNGLSANHLEIYLRY